VEDEGLPISYKALARGVRVVTADGAELGTVYQVLDNLRENIFDGLVVETPGAGRRFVDAPEVARITERMVTLSMDASEAENLPEYQRAAPEYQANPRAGRIGRFLGGGWRRR
jgi:sporulation protein YlmC with PRC-barrel domain